MATTESAVPVNGNYGHQAYESNNYAAASTNNNSTYAPSSQPPSSQGTASQSTAEIPKDEVGWYFVEQYYTTLSKSPDRLYLFYNKRSQFVSGTEEDKIQVCIGQKAINERIKDLDFHDTKVRVTNVDSQGSDANIVIQVIGEISNRGQPHKRFVQTFVLAEQTNGYFVLNDIFRYLADEPEEEEEPQHESTAPATNVEEPVPAAAVPEDEGPNEGSETAQSDDDLVKVDKKLEEVTEQEPERTVSPPPAAVNGTPVPDEAEVVHAEEAPVAAVSAPEETPSAEPEEAVAEVTEPEKPKDPAPTPAPAAQKPAAATPSVPSKPAAPRTWASLAASAHKVVTPAVPVAPASQGSSQPKAPASAPSQPSPAPAAQATAPAPAPAREDSPATSQGEAAGWQSVTGHKKEQSRAQNQAPVADSDNRRAYIKNVYSQVEEPSLRSALTKFGEIEYLDISRQKNCAFVDFKTAAGFQSAVNSNPHTVNGIEIKVEERRPNPPNHRYTPYARGNNRGRGGIGNQSPRGGFQTRGGRGGSIGRGGRGAPQEA
ncbi:hypothetical protein K491DRAFT_712835 [Lophiostoma macrostomum CBS 122681]|uniref:NTF2-domain-containing protein n=1 Tax=Lophiostoma macrostomum CBS 122681 TaxID=1314788 RepID=A0A6A6TJB3_9PLEO|nr:hypothetical protein K491DRAFT_712835 [Lophiostoma macrostomum CBS 122681]